jgi:two-component system response regulator QseB
VAAQILVVEDEVAIQELIALNVRQAGHRPTLAADAEEGLARVQQSLPDLILLDWMLPGMSGIDFLRRLRANGRTQSIPVIMLTARAEEQDKLLGLEHGADDYITKPFDLNELGARVRALTRRAQGRAEAVLQYGPITIDIAAHSVTLNGNPINVPRREFALLQKLVESRGQVLSREKLMQSIYSWDEEVDSNALEVHIHNLRKKLNANFIRTIRGIGYLVDKLPKDDSY